ncbi:MAG: transcription antitermination factor NusB [bacterium]
MSNRHLARTIAMQTLFLWDFNEQPQINVKEVVASSFANFAQNMTDHSFTENIVNGVIENVASINDYIIRYATEWPLDQITLVDRNVLRVGVFELIYNEDIPAKVAINEAIEIAKKFGGEASGRFVNGVLGAIYKDLDSKGLIKKNPIAPKEKTEDKATEVNELIEAKSTEEL